MSFFAKFFHSFSSSEPGFLFMWILLIVGVFCVAITIERFIYLTMKSGFKTELFIKDILKHIQKDDIAAAQNMCTKGGRMALAEVIKAGIDSARLGADQIRNAIDEATLKSIPKLEKKDQLSSNNWKCSNIDRAYGNNLWPDSVICSGWKTWN